jgi:glucose/mannose-6-phosphate isomerase
MAELVAQVTAESTAPAAAAEPPAEVLARVVDTLRGRLPLVWAPEAMAGVARRWKTQLNENAKAGAAWETLPELHHNTVVGLEDAAGAGGDLAVVLLAGRGAAERTARRLALTEAVLAEGRLAATTVWAPPGGLFAQGLWLVQLGDLVSVRLAGAYGVDPTPVPQLDRLKARLAADGGPGQAAP